MATGAHVAAKLVYSCRGRCLTCRQEIAYGPQPRPPQLETVEPLENWAGRRDGGSGGKCRVQQTWLGGSHVGAMA